jgi:hypothetical protein
MVGLGRWIDAKPWRLWFVLGIHTIILIALLMVLCDLLDIIDII